MTATLIELRCDSRVQPWAVEGRPRLSWRADGFAPVTADVRLRGSAGSTWSGSSTRPWVVADVDLQPDEVVEWDVAGVLPDGTEVIASSSFRMAPGPGAWDGADWIGLVRGPYQNDLDRPCPRLRGDLTLPAPVATARLLITAGGLYRAWVNGELLPGELLPGLTDYRLRVPYQSFDVTALLREGCNSVAAVVADGWWSGYLGFTTTRGHFGADPVLRAVLDVTCTDGTRHQLLTGPDWLAGFGEVRAADLQHGQVEDARLRFDGWQSPDCALGWGPAEVLPGPGSVLSPQVCDPVQVAKVVPAVACSEPLPGSWVYDLGANVVGRPRVRLTGPAGTVVRLRHAEAVEADGTLHTASLRSATQVDHVVLAGGDLVFEPVFTTHGFRYVEVTGCAPTLADVAAVVLSSAPRLTGSFRCSSPLVDRLVDNVGRSLQGNFIEVPTDCPQRDERLGWTGDAQVFARTACLLTDVAAFFDKWLLDLYDAQSSAGAFPDVAPRLAMETDGAPGWGDAGAVIPWVLWESYGDRRVLQRAHGPMRAWVEHITSLDDGLLWRGGRGNDYGDWLAPLPPGDPGLTSKDLLAAAFAGYSARLLARVSAELDDPRAAGDAAHADAVAAAFRQAHLPSLDTWTQTACALAIRFELLDPDNHGRVAAQLVSDVEERGHLTTGFLGVGHLLPALTLAGRTDLAYGLLLREQAPSWLYPVRVGATSVWERWDGWTEEHGFANPFMNSFNHYSLGSVVEWLQSTVAGLSPVVPGWEVAQVAPVPGPGLEWARGEVPTPYGLLACGWRKVGTEVHVDVTVPPGMVARVRLPVSEGQTTFLEGASCEPVLELRHGAWHLEVR